MPVQALLKIAQPPLTTTTASNKALEIAWLTEAAERRGEGSESERERERKREESDDVSEWRVVVPAYLRLGTFGSANLL